MLIYRSVEYHTSQHNHFCQYSIHYPWPLNGTIDIVKNGTLS
jgi:hypothetical protein